MISLSDQTIRVDDIRVPGIWRALTPSARRWLFVNAVAVPAVANAVLNYGIAWFGTRNGTPVGLWAWPWHATGSMVDTLITAFVLPFLTTLTCTATVVHDLRRGRLEALAPDVEGGRRFARFPGPVAPRALCIAALTVVVAGSLAIVVFEAGQIGTLSVTAFRTFKVAFAVGLGLVVTPLIALVAMSAPVPDR